MKKHSKNSHKSFVLSDVVSENKKRQIFANVLLIVILGIQIYNLVNALELFERIKFM